MVSGVHLLQDGKTPATEDQIESKETKIAKYDKREYLAQHIILSTTSTRLGVKIKNMKTAKKMWDVVKMDVTSKSTLFILDAEDQISSIVMCRLWPEARSRAKPSPKKPGQAGPQCWPKRAFGSAWV